MRKNSLTTKDSQFSSSRHLLNNSRQDSGLENFAQSINRLSSLRVKPSLWQKFANLSIAHKQLIVLIASELIAILGVGIISRYLTTSNLQALSLEQAKSEVAVTDMAYNIKVNQMSFGFRGQSDNTAIIKAARLNASGQSLSPSLKAEVKQILQNEIKARTIEYATLVGKDFQIIVNANADRQGEIFNPDNLVSEVFNYPKQIKTSRIVKWSELSRESPPLPSGFRNKDALIRYIVTPVKDPETNLVIGALVSGDIVNGKESILRSTLTTPGGYSAVYFRKPTGEFTLATSLDQDESKKLSNFDLPKTGKSLLETALNSEGEPVTARIKIDNQTYTVATKAVPYKIIQADDEPIAIFTKQPVAILVRVTPETALNKMLAESFWVQLFTVILALAIILIWTWIQRQTIIKPIQGLQRIALRYAAGDRTARSEIFSADEIGELAVSFNQLADKITQQVCQNEDEVKVAKLVHEITGRCRGSLNTQYILNAAVTTVQAALEADRVIVYKFDENWQGKIIAESLNPEFPVALGAEIADPCFANNYVEKYQKGRVQALTNIYAADLTDCHLAQLEQFAVKANLVAPILINNKLYGLLIAHQCSRPRQWQELEINLLRQVAIPIGYALEQASLIEKITNASSRAEVVSDDQLQQQQLLQQQIFKLLKDIDKASQGDLTVKAEVIFGEIGIIAENFNTIVDNLRAIVVKVESSTSQVNIAVNENEDAIRQLSEKSLTQDTKINVTLDNVHQMTGSLQSMSENAQKAALYAHTVSLNAQESGTAMDLTMQNILNLRSTIDGMAKKVKRLAESSLQISRIISLIEEIGARANILAVNAELEAVRINEGNNSFLVFATELDELAIRCTGATQEIEQIAKNTQRDTQEVVKAMELGTSGVVKGTHLVEDVKKSLNQILNVSQQLDELVQSISQSTGSQVETSQAVTKLIEEISQVSEITSSYQIISQSLQKTVDIAQELQTNVSKFKIN
ncbi:methyl-accepting chemotaxis protein [Plectonema radiosum NIES-515]|uniref:Methyl-accepting chemotaxis protein n=1 Tax=Plectonema radiosum NIES-515 TaxID=2986073 RepID=A0ABT3ASJ4_9CYAN|nr:methyl-accepting chemotaxis protein [Plectonema radiosum]MCV3212083.1 methyl-accepting chemotaxis protein [Plectonema radiosum NIES-515]